MHLDMGCLTRNLLMGTLTLSSAQMTDEDILTVSSR